MMFIVVSDRLFDQFAHFIKGGKVVVKARTRRRQGMAAAEGTCKEFMRPKAIMVGLPHLLALVCLQPLNPRFTPLAPLDHTLQCFQAMKVIAIDATVADTERLGHRGPQRQIKRRGAPGHRQRGAGHQGKAQLAGKVVHLLGPIPTPGEMFIVEDGHTTPSQTIDRNDLLEKFIAGVEGLALGVGTVLAMFTDEQHTINGQVIRPQRERVSNRRVDLHGREARRPISAQIPIRHLIDVERDQIHRWPMVMAIPAIAFEKAVDKVLGMGILVDNSTDGGDFWASVSHGWISASLLSKFGVALLG